MEKATDLEEKVRESASIGNEYELQRLVLEKGVDVNSRNKMNGWTALHWACKRGHTSIVSFLIKHGADISLQNFKGQTPLQVTDFSKNNGKIVEMLGGEMNGSAFLNDQQEELPITPNYISNPPFPHVSQSMERPVRGPTPFRNSHPNSQYRQSEMHNYNNHQDSVPQPPNQVYLEDDELVLKIRVANAMETDFIEVELERKHLTFQNLFSTMCKELEVRSELVHKVRKLPDTIIRKDKDVWRLKDFQEMELVLTNKAVSSSSRHYAGTVANPNTSPTKSNLKPFDVVY